MANGKTMNASQHDNLLLIAARKPVPGETKTRLGATIGMNRAAALYRAFLHDLAGRFMAGQREYDLGWAYTPESAPFEEVIADIRPDLDTGSVQFVCQEGDDWAERQANLLRWGSEHGYARTVLTASDSPHMSREVVACAFRELDTADVVVGRVHDGGYYLIGVRGFHDVVTGVPMSTSSAADALIARSRAQGLRVAMVAPLFDIDVEADLNLLNNLVDCDPEAAPATRMALARVGLAEHPTRSAEARLNGASRWLPPAMRSIDTMAAGTSVRTRILDMAAHLFYQQGLRAVGVDEIVARSGVAKTSLYAHFQSKDLLIATYLQRNSDGWHRQLDAALDAFTGTPAAALDHVFALIAEGCASPSFRGCPYINFMVEFPDRSHPGWDVCLEHRRWLHGVFARLARDGNATDPDRLADQLCLLYDAAMVGSMIDQAGRSAVLMREAAAVLVSAALP